MSAEPVVASVIVDAEPTEVYEYFTRADAMVLWMGHHASLDPRPGGGFAIDVNGVAVRGRYLELEPPNRLVISWGFAGSKALPPEASTVEVLLTPEGSGTRIEIIHVGLPETEASEHAPGWRHFLDQLAKITSVDHQNADGP